MGRLNFIESIGTAGTPSDQANNSEQVRLRYGDEAKESLIKGGRFANEFS